MLVVQAVVLGNAIRQSDEMPSESGYGDPYYLRERDQRERGREGENGRGWEIENGTGNEVSIPENETETESSLDARRKLPPMCDVRGGWEFSCFGERKTERRITRAWRFT